MNTTAGITSVNPILRRLGLRKPRIFNVFYMLFYSIVLIRYHPLVHP